MQGIVSKKKEEFEEIFRTCVVTGTVLCILAVAPVMIMAGFNASDLYLIYGTSGMFVMLAAGVFLFVWSGCIQGSFQKLLQQGDYTLEKKQASRKTAFFPGVYWCVVTAVFLCVGFISDNWKVSGLVWQRCCLWRYLEFCAPLPGIRMPEEEMSGRQECQPEGRVPDPAGSGSLPDQEVPGQAVCSRRPKTAGRICML